MSEELANEEPTSLYKAAKREGGFVPSDDDEVVIYHTFVDFDGAGGHTGELWVNGTLYDRWIAPPRHDDANSTG